MAPGLAGDQGYPVAGRLGGETRQHERPGAGSAARNAPGGYAAERKTTLAGISCAAVDAEPDLLTFLRRACGMESVHDPGPGKP